MDPASSSLVLPFGRTDDFRRDIGSVSFGEVEVADEGETGY